MNKRIAILGCGWLGLPLAVSLIEKGSVVKGSTTSESKLPRLEAKGILPYRITLSENGISGTMADFLTDVQILIVNIPPKLRGAQTENYVKKMQLLYTEVQKSDVKQVVFVSSTSVYGAFEGEVSEATIPKPSTESGRQLLAAEAIFRNTNSLQTTILRFGGLIGEDRHPIQMLTGRKGLTNGNQYINLIHQLDCIRIIEYIIKTDYWGQIVNGVYPYHPTKQEYYTSKAQKLSLQPPEYSTKNEDLGKKVIPKTLLNVKEFCFLTSIRS